MDNRQLSHGAYWKSDILPRSASSRASFDPLAYLCRRHTPTVSKSMPGWGEAAEAMYRVSTVWPPAGNATLAAHPEWMMVPQAEQ